MEETALVLATIGVIFGIIAFVRLEKLVNELKEKELLDSNFK